MSIRSLGPALQLYPRSSPIRPSLLLPGATTTVSVEPAEHRLLRPKYLETLAPVSFAVSMASTVFGAVPPRSEFKASLKTPYGQDPEPEWHAGLGGVADMDFSVTVAGKYTVEATGYLSREFVIIDLGRGFAQFEVLYPAPGIWDSGWIVSGARADEVLDSSAQKKCTWFSLYSPDVSEPVGLRLEFFWDGQWDHREYKRASMEVGKSYVTTVGMWSNFYYVGHTYAVRSYYYSAEGGGKNYYQGPPDSLRFA